MGKPLPLRTLDVMLSSQRVLLAVHAVVANVLDRLK